MSLDTGSNVLVASVGEAAESAGAAPAAGAPSPWGAKIRRRAKILMLLHGCGTVGTSIDDLVKDALRDCPEASWQNVRHDLLRLIDAGLAEKLAARNPNGPELFILSQKGEYAIEKKTYHQVAESVTPEEEPAAPPTETAAAAPLSPGQQWQAAAEASAAREAAEKAEQAEKASKGKKSRKKKEAEASPQLGLGSAPGRFTRRLQVPVDESALRRSGETLLDIGRERDTLEDDKKAYLKSYSEKRERLEERDREARGSLSEALRGFRYDDIECQYKLDGSTMRIFRTDTGEQIEERAATSAELEAANPPEASAPPPEGAEVREAGVSSTNEAQGQAVSTNGATAAETTEKPKARRGRKPKAEQAATTTH